MVDVKHNLDKSIQDMAKDNCIVRHLAGSHAYGTSTPTSDTDYRGIFIADPQYILTPFYNVETVEIAGEEDTVYHEVGKYVQLLVDQNPNIIETLWVNDGDIQFRKPEYDYLRTCRQSLLSSKCLYTYCGYANSQLKRLKGHHQWLQMMDRGKQQLREIRMLGLLSVQHLRNHFDGEILDAIKVPYCVPVKLQDVDYDWITILDVFSNPKYHDARMMCNIPYMEYEFAHIVTPPNRKIVDYRQDHVAVKAPGSGNVYHLHYKKARQLYDGRGTIVDNHGMKSTELESGVGVMEINSGFKSNYQERWGNYHKWRANRNVTRSGYEAAHGYDTKHASHLIRLLKTGCEILEHQEVFVKRPDAQELTDIRNGSLTLDELLQYSSSLESKCLALYETTKLQKNVDRSHAATVMINIRTGNF